MGFKPPKNVGEIRFNQYFEFSLLAARNKANDMNMCKYI
jgi:hypothetical protein